MLVDSDYIYCFIFVFNSLLEDTWCDTKYFVDDVYALHFKLARPVLNIPSFEFALI